MALIRKRRLTEQQQRRIQKQQQTRQEDIDTSNDLEGLVVQHYGRQLEVQALTTPDPHPIKPTVQAGEPEPFWKPIELGSIWRCHTRTNLELLVTPYPLLYLARGFGRLPQSQRHVDSCCLRCCM